MQTVQVQEQDQKYAIVKTDNGEISAIPLLWLSHNNFLFSGQRCEWYYPSKCKTDESVKFENRGFWAKEIGCFLYKSDSYEAAKFLVIVETIKIKKFAIVELTKNNVIMIIPCCSILINHDLRKFTCRLNNTNENSENQHLNSWNEYECIIKNYFDTFCEAKEQMCQYINTTVVQNEHNKRKHIEGYYLNSSNSCNNAEQHSIMTTTQLSKSTNNIGSNLDDSMNSSNTKKFKDAVVTKSPVINNILAVNKHTHEVTTNVNSNWNSLSSLNKKEYFNNTLSTLTPTIPFTSMTPVTYNTPMMPITHYTPIAPMPQYTPVDHNTFKNSTMTVKSTLLYSTRYNHQVPMTINSTMTSMTPNTPKIPMTVNSNMVYNTHNTYTNIVHNTPYYNPKILVNADTTMTSAAHKAPKVFNNHMVQMTQNASMVPVTQQIPIITMTPITPMVSMTNNTPMVPVNQNASMVPVNQNASMVPITHNNSIITLTPSTRMVSMTNTPIVLINQNAPMTYNTPIGYLAPITPINSIASITPINPINSENTLLRKSKLQFPITNIEDLKKFDTNAFHRQSLIQKLMHKKKYNVRHTTYQVMKTVMNNNVAKYLNVTSQKGNKLCLLDMELYPMIVYCIKYFYPEEPQLNIRKYIGDWLRQAPARRQE